MSKFNINELLESKKDLEAKVKDVDMLIWVNKQGRIIYDYWAMVYVQKHIHHAIE